MPGSPRYVHLAATWPRFLGRASDDGYRGPGAERAEDLKLHPVNPSIDRAADLMPEGEPGSGVMGGGSGCTRW